MSEYTPTTKEVRGWVVGPDYAGGPENRELGVQFDRWLAQVRAEAWDECARWAGAHTAAPVLPIAEANPYRKEADRG